MTSNDEKGRRGRGEVKIIFLSGDAGNAEHTKSCHTSLGTRYVEAEPMKPTSQE